MTWINFGKKVEKTCVSQIYTKMCYCRSPLQISSQAKNEHTWPRQNGRHFPEDIFKCIFLNENIWISIKVSLKFVPKGTINNIPALVQKMAWRRPGGKPLSEPILVSLLMHICVTWPQGVKGGTVFLPNPAWWVPVVWTCVAVVWVLLSATTSWRLLCRSPWRPPSQHSSTSGLVWRPHWWPENEKVTMTGMVVMWMMGDGWWWWWIWQPLSEQMYGCPTN